jgi:hypothetical protein
MISARHYIATYNETGLSHYDGNPLIESLPAIFSEIDVVRMLGAIPPLPSESELELEPKLRSHCVSRLKDIVVPLDIHLQLEDGFSQLLRYGYTARNPFTVAGRKFTNASEPPRGFKSSADIMTLIGLSGMGKTTALDAITKNYPQVILHKEYKGQIFIQTQVVWLKIDCPHDGSLRGFCSAFFAALDNALGIDKYFAFGAGRYSISVMLQKISQLCKTYFVGALIIDEMQHLNSSRGGIDREKLLNFFVTLSNDAGVPLVYVGTNAMLPLFSGVVRNARRAVGLGEITFDRYIYGDPFWDHLVDCFWKYTWVGKPTPISDELREIIYDLSQGNTDFLVKLLTLAQRHAIWERAERVTPQILKHVFDNQMRMLHKPIQALRSRDPQQIADFEDMMPTKDQVIRMMNYDLVRSAKRADFALFSTPALDEKAVSIKPPDGKPAVAVQHNPDLGRKVYIDQSANVQSELIERGWVDKDPVW